MRTSYRIAAPLGVTGILTVLVACSTFGSDAPNSSSEDSGAPQSDARSVDEQDPVTGSPPIVLSYNGPPVLLTGESAEVTVTVQRDGAQGFSGKVHLAIAPTPGVSALEVDIPADQESAILKVSSATTRKHGRLDLPIVATAPPGMSTGSVTYPVLIRGPVGSVDTSFGVDGIFSLGEASSASGIVVEGGNVYMGGTIGADLGVVSLTKDGTLDSAFGSGGVFRVNVGTLVSTAEMIGSAKGVYLGATVTSGGVSSAVLASVVTGGKADPKFGLNGVASVPLQTASTLAFSPATALPAGILVGGRKDAASADSQVVIVQADGTLSTLWGSGGTLKIANDCPGGADNTDCVARGFLVGNPTGQLRTCAFRHGGSIVGGRQYGIDDTPIFADFSTSPYVNRCTSMATGGVNGGVLFVAGETNGVASVARYVGTQIDANFAIGGVAAPTATGPANSGMTIARKVLVQGDGTLVIAADTIVGGHGAFAGWRVLANGKTDTSFSPPNGFTTKVVGTTDVVVSGMGIDDEKRLVIVGSNGHMVATRLWQ